ncbi:MAG TPA: membrane protein insertase YidC [Streptosporangiaceae bacterium]
MNAILGPIDTAVAWIITQLFNLLSPVFGGTSGITWLLTIMILVVLMRLILVPLFIKQMHTQRAMTALTPRLQELRKKHKGDRETLNAETMKLYQEAGVNPLMGCLPIVLQMPIFFALFSVIRYIAEWKPFPKAPIQYGLTQQLIVSAQHAKIFGIATIGDKVLFNHTPVALSSKIVIVIVVLISMATTFLTVRQSMKRGMMPTGSDSPMGQSQKLMAYIMPLFALTGLYWQFGLVLYWVTTNLWTLGQQFVLLRKYPVGAAAMGPDGNKPVVKPKPATASGFTSGSARQRPPGGKPESGKPAAGKPAEKGRSAAAGTGGAKASPASPDSASSNGHQPTAAEGGMLRKFGRGKAEPEPAAPAEPEAKIVRQQRQRQSRSKRTGKR